MKRYFIGIGSNINPEENLPRILEALLEITPIINISRVIETQPENLASSNKFLNCAIAFVSALNEFTLKEHFNKIEIEMGRNRADPDSKTKDRIADIDILFSMNVDLECAPTKHIPVEPYLRPQTIELIISLGLDCGIPLNTIPRGVPLLANGTAFGTYVVTLER